MFRLHRSLLWGTWTIQVKGKFFWLDAENYSYYSYEDAYKSMLEMERNLNEDH